MSDKLVTIQLEHTAEWHDRGGESTLRMFKLQGRVFIDENDFWHVIVRDDSLEFSDSYLTTTADTRPKGKEIAVAKMVELLGATLL